MTSLDRPRARDPLHRIPILDRNIARPAPVFSRARAATPELGFVAYALAGLAEAAESAAADGAEGSVGRRRDGCVGLELRLGDVLGDVLGGGSRGWVWR